MHRFLPKDNSSPLLAYATCADFCGILAKNLRPLYLLAFLLTGNHTEAEQCFVATIEDCIGAKSVFKGWENSWSKRCLIINAIRRVFVRHAKARQAQDQKRRLDRQNASVYWV